MEMEDSVRAFPFHKLKDYKYLTLEVMTYVEHSKSCLFMFTFNKETRNFLQHNIIDIQNGFINEGLIEHDC